MNTQQLADGSKQYIFHPITSIDVAIDNETQMMDLQAEMEDRLLSAHPSIDIYNGAWMFRSENQFLDVCASLIPSSLARREPHSMHLHSTI